MALLRETGEELYNITFGGNMVASVQELETRSDARDAMVGLLPVGASKKHIDEAVRKLYDPAEGFPEHLRPVDDWDERLQEVCVRVAADLLENQ